MIDTDSSTCEVLPPVSGELVPAANMAALELLDPLHQELAVTNMLGEARQWLAHAVEATEPRPAAQFKAMVASIVEVTKQFGLSKEIQLDAIEMMRRAERGVGVAIREGQDEGTVRRSGQVESRSNQYGKVGNSVDNSISSTKEFASNQDLSGNGTGIYAMTDDVSEEQFQEALAEAKDEGDLSRANVVRKVKKEPAPLGKRHELLKNTHHHDVARIVEQTAFALEGLVMGLGLVAPGTVPEESKAAHAKSIGASLSKIRTFLNSEMRLP